MQESSPASTSTVSTSTIDDASNGAQVCSRVTDGLAYLLDNDEVDVGLYRISFRWLRLVMFGFQSPTRYERRFHSSPLAALECYQCVNYVA